MKKIFIALLFMSSLPAFAAESVTCRVADLPNAEATGVFSEEGFAYLTITGIQTRTATTAALQVEVKKLDAGKVRLAARVINQVSRIQVELPSVALPASVEATEAPYSAEFGYQLHFNLSCDPIVTTN